MVAQLQREIFFNFFQEGILHSGSKKLETCLVEEMETGFFMLKL